MFLSIATFVALAATLGLQTQAGLPVISQDAPVPVHRAGTADFIGSNNTGTFIFRNGLRPRTFFVPILNSIAWPPDRAIRTLGDTRGVGLADLVGFGGNEVWIAQNNGDGTFARGQSVVPFFGSNPGAGNWSLTRHVRYLANVRGVDKRGDDRFGAVDVIGFGEDGVWVAVNKNDGSGTFFPPKLALGVFGYGDGWRIEKHLRFLADVDGDGKLDIVGFGDAAVYVALNTGGGTFASHAVALNQYFTPATGWEISKHRRFLADLTRSGKVDIVGFGDGGVYTSLGINGSGIMKFAEPRLVLNVFGYNDGWRVENHPRFVVDVNNDGFPDIVGFGDYAVYVSFGLGDGSFAPHQVVLSNKFTYLGDGWQVGKHIRVLADLDGDGAPEIVGFGEEDVWVSWNDGKGAFGNPVAVTKTFGYTGGQWGSTSVRHVANMFAY